MKKFILFVLLCVATTAHAQIEMGTDVRLFVGAGLSCQTGEFSSTTDFQEVGFVFEFGAVYKQCVEMDVDFSLANNPMMSIDINGRTPLYMATTLLYGAGYGFVYYDGVTYEEISAPGETVRSSLSGSMAWPHVNVGISYPLNENLEVRLMGVVGYSKKVYYSEDESSWHFTSQIRATAVWNF